MRNFIYTESDSTKHGYRRNGSHILMYELVKNRPIFFRYADFVPSKCGGIEKKAMDLIMEAYPRIKLTDFLSPSEKYDTHTGPGCRLFGV